RRTQLGSSTCGFYRLREADGLGFRHTSYCRRGAEQVLLQRRIGRPVTETERTTSSRDSAFEERLIDFSVNDGVVVPFLKQTDFFRLDQKTCCIIFRNVWGSRNFPVGDSCRGRCDRSCGEQANAKPERRRCHFASSARRRAAPAKTALNYLKRTSTICNSGYVWFHSSLTCSKVRRKAMLCPGANGAAVMSTVSGYGPVVRKTRTDGSSICATCP